MKKKLLALGALSAVAIPVISVVSCGTKAKESQAQKDVNAVMTEFTKAKLSVNTTKAVAAVTKDTDFNKAVLTALGGTITGTYPTATLPKDVSLKYQVGAIAEGKEGNITVKVMAKGATTKTFTIKVTVKNSAQDDVDAVVAEFTKAALSVNTQTVVAAVTKDTDFNKAVLTALGGTITGTYPTTKLPSDVSLKYQVEAIAKGHDGNITVKVMAQGANTKTFTIKVTVSN